jgi:hypothetical protein
MCERLGQRVKKGEKVATNGDGKKVDALIAQIYEALSVQRD